MPRRRRRAYPSDLTRSQWALIAPMIPNAEAGGRPRKADNPNNAWNVNFNNSNINNNNKNNDNHVRAVRGG